jgi:plasmid stabilization system protein ParE
LQELADECDRLAGSTAIEAFGTPAPGIGTDVRLIAFRRWVILFRYQHDGVMILRIADGSQNYLKWKLGE